MAFALDTMAFSQWLHHLHTTGQKPARNGEKFPPDSDNAAQAVREFDGDDKAQGLVALLSSSTKIISGRSFIGRTFQLSLNEHHLKEMGHERNLRIHVLSLVFKASISGSIAFMAHLL